MSIIDTITCCIAGHQRATTVPKQCIDVICTGCNVARPLNSHCSSGKARSCASAQGIEMFHRIYTRAFLSFAQGHRWTTLQSVTIWKGMVLRCSTLNASSSLHRCSYINNDGHATARQHERRCSSGQALLCAATH